jgi:hypothetical protein
LLTFGYGDFVRVVEKMREVFCVLSGANAEVGRR